MSEPTEVSITDSEVFMLHEIVTGLDRIARLAYLERHGLSFTEFLVMMMVNELDLPSQTDVARVLDFSNSSVSQKVTSLRQKEMLEQHRDPESRRTVRLSLTEQGRDTLAIVYRELAQAASSIFDVLGERRPAFHQALSEVRGALRAAPDAKAFAGRLP